MTWRGGVIGGGLTAYCRRHANMITRESVPPNISSKTGVRAIEIDRFAGFRSGVVLCGLGAYRAGNADVIVGAGIPPDPAKAIFARIRAVYSAGVDSGRCRGIILRCLQDHIGCNTYMIIGECVSPGIPFDAGIGSISGGV